MPIEEKTKQFLSYIIKQFKSASVTTLMKLAYLIDLVAVGRTKHQISNFKYRRYKYGPFDSKIYAYLDCLLNEHILEDYTQIGPPSEEFIVYAINEKKTDIVFHKLSAEEIKIIGDVVNNLAGYGAKTITEIAYKTKPMIALGATLGGTEGLNEPLDLNAK